RFLRRHAADARSDDSPGERHRPMELLLGRLFGVVDRCGGTLQRSRDGFYGRRADALERRLLATAASGLCFPLMWNLREHWALAKYALKWTALSVPLAAVVGSACALFLWSLDGVTRYRWEHPNLLFGLPAAGVLVGLAYHFFG